jgi:magnesium transporter
MTQRLATGTVNDCAYYRDGRRHTGDVPIRRSAPGDGGFLWIALHCPSADDMAALADLLGLPALAVEDAVQAHQRPKLDTYDDVAFVVLKPIRQPAPGQRLESGETAVFLGPGFIVTVRHGDDTVLEGIRRELDDGGEQARYSPFGVLHRLADLVVDEYETVLDALDSEIDDVEEQVFGPPDTDQAERIYQLKRQMAELRRVVAPLVAPMHRLATGTVTGVDPDLAPHFRDVHDHVLRAADAVEAADRVLSDVLQADMSQVSVRQNEIALRQNEVAARQNEDMRKISAWAAIGLVPTGVAGIYGMNFDNMPELHTRYGYYVVLAVILTTCLILYRLFRRNGWL